VSYAKAELLLSDGKLSRPTTTTRNRSSESAVLVQHRAYSYCSNKMPAIVVDSRSLLIRRSYRMQNTGVAAVPSSRIITARP